MMHRQIVVDPRRVRLLQEGSNRNGVVVYWMSRDQRTEDNWALLHALQIANKRQLPLMVVFTLVPDFLEATERQYAFMLKGLHEVEQKLRAYMIPFAVLPGDPAATLPRFLKDVKASVLVSDFDPLKVKRIWKRDVAKGINIPFYEVDAHNVVPALYVTNKEEFGAYTIRPKIHKLLPEFLTDFPSLEEPVVKEHYAERVDWEALNSSLKINHDVKEVATFKPGSAAAERVMQNFLMKKIDHYNDLRNDPTEEYQSDLSPYLHFGQISPQRVAHEAFLRVKNVEAKDAFLEELIVRRELADNFCYFNTKYDSFDGLKDWAKLTLNQHRDDRREYIYSLEQFETSATHEDLWNAAQLEMVKKGKMHGYMRMYWAKKILEWSESPEEAMRIAIYLNDKYSLDGRDPNGYTGVAWSVGGIHDRAWTERPVFGKIRYMNYNGCKRKFDTALYIKKCRV
ncbi:MAG: deoxyribodipyrimidine photo-lyase [Ignavibacteriaceae bacterium]|nr:MAG: deoxyribodipyrimidine photo-lyase [Ignavibacteriaceae bacterium]